jgi:hypothetical protein
MEDKVPSSLTHAPKAAARALKMLAYIVLLLWMSNHAFPSNWLALGILYVALIPVALLYKWLTDPRANPEAKQLFFPVPKFVVIVIGATIAFLGFVMYDTAITSVLYPQVR